jgi:hypothetical protein
MGAQRRAFSLTWAWLMLLIIDEIGEFRRMKKINTILAIFVTFAAVQTQAMSIDWSGLYRFEYVQIDNTSLDSPNLRKSYLLNHLQLAPKIYAADGVVITSKINMLPNKAAKYASTAHGQSFGAGANTTGTSSSSEDSNVMGKSQPGTSPSVTQLYLNINQEYGSLLLGRAPIHFGLGMAHNAGNGTFDHWASVSDLVAYKFIVGNVFFMPIIGKAYDSSPLQGEDVTDQSFMIQYENQESGSTIGVLQQKRSSNVSVNDAPKTELAGTGATYGAGYSHQDINVYFAKAFEQYNLKLEAGFLSGSTGVFTAAGEQVSLNSYGVAFEFGNKGTEKLKWNFRLGVASGDDPNTKDFEGYAFNRNYKVSSLLFQHRLGQMDLLKSAVWGSSNNTGTSLDDEVLSNALYISPVIEMQQSDKMSLRHTFTMASILQQPSATISGQKDLGLEYDLGVVYRATDRIEWVNELALLSPGGAFKGGSLDLGNKFTFGIMSKAAISF